MAIAVGQMDRIIVLYAMTETADGIYGGQMNRTYNAIDELIYAHVIWKGGAVGEDGEQMQNNQVIEFYVRNGGAMLDATVKDYILFDNQKCWIDSINVVDGRKKYLQILTTQIEAANPAV